MRNGSKLRGIADSIYLSIDLDVFADKKLQPYFDKIMGRVIRHDNVRVCMSHEKLVPHVNKSPARTLWNIDYHTDLYTEEDSENRLSLDCGNWCSFVKWRHGRDFVWVYSERNRNIAERTGRCDGREIWELENTAKFKWRVKVRSIRRAIIPWHRVERIGVAVSPDYSDPAILTDLVAASTKNIRDWFQEHNIFTRARNWDVRNCGGVFGWPKSC